MGRKGKPAKQTALPLELLGFKSAVETRNVFDGNSVLSSQEVSLCANDYTGFRFLNSQIVAEIGLDFNLMCIRDDNKLHRFYYPCELGLVVYSMLDGIVDEYHSFIDCGSIPEGYAYQASQYESVHQIPLLDRSELQKLCKASTDSIVENLIHRLTTDDKILTKDKKFVCFNVPEKRTQTYGSYEWLDSNSSCVDGIKLPEMSALSVYDLTFEIANFMEVKELADYKVLENDYMTVASDCENGNCCAYHSNVYCNNCCIANCRRLASIFSMQVSRCFPDLKPTTETSNRVKREGASIVKFKKPRSSKPSKTSKCSSSREANSLPPGFAGRANVAKDERRVGRRVKTVPPGFEGSAKRTVNIDSVVDAVRKTYI